MQDEVLLQERVDTLVSNVTNIAQQWDVERIHETALDVKRVWKAMMDCRELGLLLNERQKMFGMKVVPFEHLHKLIREFEPYRSLWVTASGKWSKLQRYLHISGARQSVPVLQSSTELFERPEPKDISQNFLFATRIARYF